MLSHAFKGYVMLYGYNPYVILYCLLLNFDCNDDEAASLIHYGTIAFNVYSCVDGKPTAASFRWMLSMDAFVGCCIPPHPPL